MLQVDDQKKNQGRLITVATLGLDKFRHVLDVDLLKKRSSVVDRFINKIFGSGKVLYFVGGKHQQPSDNNVLCMCE